MPTNKHASFRYRVLDQCFCNRGRRKWSLQELVAEVSRYLQEEFGVDIVIGKRTIQGDINVMRSRPPRGYNAPIHCEQGMYYYTDPEYRIEKPPLRQDELNILREVVALVKQIPGMPQLPLLDLIMQRFETVHLSNGSLSNFIQLETNYQAKGTEWIAPIYSGIVSRQVLSIEYQPFMERKEVYCIHPYLLKEWRNRWYVFCREGLRSSKQQAEASKAGLERTGFIQRKDHLWNFPLDRILSVGPVAGAHYIPNDLFDPATWFDDIVGVTKPEDSEPVDIKIEVDTVASFYVETKPFHRSQELICRDDSRAVFSLKLIPNHEIINDLLSYGKHIRVLSPDSFCQMLADRKG